MQEKNKDYWGFLNKNGTYIYTSTSLEEIYSFKEGLTCIRKDGKVVFMDTNLNVYSKPEIKITSVTELKQFSEGLIAFQDIYKYGYMNKEGKVVIQPKYDKVTDFSEGLAAVRLGENRIEGRWGFIDKQGNVIIDFKFFDVKPFKNGLAWVYEADESGYSYKWTKKENWGYIDKTGKYVWKPGQENNEMNIENK